MDWVASSELPSRIPGLSMWMGLTSIHMTARTESISEFRRIVLVKRQLEGSASTRHDPFFSSSTGTLDTFALEQPCLILGSTRNVWVHYLTVTMADGQLASCLAQCPGTGGCSVKRPPFPLPSSCFCSWRSYLGLRGPMNPYIF